MAKVLTLNDIVHDRQKQLILSKDTITRLPGTGLRRRESASLWKARRKLKDQSRRGKDTLLNSNIVSIVRQLKSNNMTLKRMK